MFINYHGGGVIEKWGGEGCRINEVSIGGGQKIIESKGLSMGGVRKSEGWSMGGGHRIQGVVGGRGVIESGRYLTTY